MTGSTSESPSFHNPPVSDVVLGSSFKPLRDFGMKEQIRLWQDRYATLFPEVGELPPYEPPVEMLDAPPRIPSISFGMTQGPPSMRLLFGSSDGTTALQLQRDWFAHSWRRATPETEYRRYPAGRTQFLEKFEELRAFATDGEHGELIPEQCEVTYVNRIEPSGVWETHGDIARAIRLAGKAGGEFLGRLETSQLSASALIVEQDAPVGRLHIQAQPAFADGDPERPIFILTLTARGRPRTPDIDGLVTFLDIGHKWVVRSFADVTTKELHQAWGRYE